MKYTRRIFSMLILLSLILTGCCLNLPIPRQEEPETSTHEIAISMEEVIAGLSSETVQVSPSVSLVTPAPEDVTYDEQTGTAYVNNTLIVYVQAGTDPGLVEELAADHGATVVGQVTKLDGYQLQLAAAMDMAALEALAAQMEEAPFVDYVLTDELLMVSPDYMPDDGWTEEGWSQKYKNEDSKTVDNLWGIKAIHAEKAWDYLEQMDNVTIGQIEEVTSRKHEDLQIKDVVNGSALSAVTATAYGIGREDHGTHVGGIMAAKADNGIGIAGVCAIEGTDVVTCNSWNGITVNNYMSGLSSLITDYNINVINISQHYGSYSLHFAATQGVEKAINKIQKNAEKAEKVLNRLLDRGYEFVLCVAAGNSNAEKFYKTNRWVDSNWDVTYGYTLSYGSASDTSKTYSGVDAKWNHFLCAIEEQQLVDRIIVVGNAKLAKDGYASSPSSCVGGRVDIMAPGTDICSLTYGGKYKLDSGTSMATPHVSGVAAMLFACDGGLSGKEVKEYICSTADRTYADHYTDVDAGMLRADLAVEAVLADSVEVLPTALKSCFMAFKELDKLKWDSSQCEQTGNGWVLIGNWGPATYSYTFPSTELTARPSMLYVTDHLMAPGLAITDEICTGMTYQQVMQLDGVSSAADLGMGFGAVLYPESGCQILLFFSGNTEDAILHSAEIAFFE